MEGSVPDAHDQSDGEEPTSQTFKAFSQDELCGALIEKEYELECAQDMLQSLSMYEAECQRKDRVIRELRRELAAYKHNSHSKDVRYVAMEEQLAVCEDQLELRTKEVEKLTLEVNSLKKKALRGATSQSSANRASVLQKEVSSKTSEILKLKQELQCLSSQHESDKESLRHSVTELQANLASLKAKVQQFKSENEELKQRLLASEAERERISEAEQKRKEEVGKLRTSLSSGKLAQAKQDFLEAEVEKTKQRENELAIQLGKVKEELSSVCQSVVSMTTRVISTTDHTPNPQTAVTIAKQLVQEYVSTQEELESSQALLTEIQKENERYVAMVTSLHQLWTVFKGELRQDVEHSTLCGKVQSAFEVLLAALRGLSSKTQANSCKELIAVMQDSLELVSTGVVVRWRELVREIESHCKQLETFSQASREPVQRLTLLSEALGRLKEECSCLSVRLTEEEEGHREALEAAKREHEDKLANAVQECLATERERLSSEMAALERRLNDEKREAVAEQQRLQSMISEQLEAAKQSLLAVQNDTDVLKAEKAGLEARLQAMEDSMREALTTAHAQQETVRSQLTEEMAGYREQSHQHALTIVALEEKLIQAMEHSRQLRAENETLSELMDSTRSQEHPASDSEQVEKLQRLTDTLRHQLSLVSSESSKSQARVKQLESDLQTVSSQVSDREAQISREFEEQLADLRLSLSRLETELEGKKAEVSLFKSLLQEKADAVAAVEKEKSVAVRRVSELLRQPKSTQEPGVLTQLGERCSGERHADTIANQRRAIAELRTRVTDLELAKPPVGSHQATLKELSRVRHELLKAQSQSMEQPATAADQSDSEEEHRLRKVNEECELKVSELQTALSELQSTLQCSEKTYKHLVDLICKNLEDVGKTAVQSFVDGSSSEQKKDILKERKKFADALLKRLKTLSQNTRSTKAGLANSSAPQAEDSPETTIANLQAALDSTMEELEQQRRLNQALVKRNVFKESQLGESAHKPHHKCIKS